MFLIVEILFVIEKPLLRPKELVGPIWSIALRTSYRLPLLSLFRDSLSNYLKSNL